MLCTAMHRELARASKKFGLAVFSYLDFRARAEAAIDEAGRREQRKRALDAHIVLTFVVFMAFHRQLGIERVLKTLLNSLREIVPDLSLVAVTPEAVCHARKRLGVEPLALLFDSLAAEIRPPPSFHGLRPWGYDGVRLTVPDTPANVKEFGRPKASKGQAAHAQMLVVALVDTQTRQVRDIAMGGCRDSERALARKFTKILGPEDLVIMDRGCSSVADFEAFINQGTHVLGRISSTWKPTPLRQLKDGSWLVQVQAYDKRRARKGRKGRNKSGRQAKPKGGQRKCTDRQPRRLISLTMRLIEYRVGTGEVCRLLTDLMDDAKYPARDLALEYYSRWECELCYDELKTHLATVTHGTLHTVLRSKTPDGARQEVYGQFIAYNLARRTMAEAGEVYDIPPLELSFVQAVDLIKEAVPRFEGTTLTQRCYLFAQLLEDIAACRNKRPRRPRSNPREVRKKMSKFRVKRRRGRGKTVDFGRQIVVTPAPMPERQQMHCGA